MVVIGSCMGCADGDMADLGDTLAKVENALNPKRQLPAKSD